MDHLELEQDRKRPRLDSGRQEPSDEALTDVGGPIDDQSPPPPSAGMNEPNPQVIDVETTQPFEDTEASTTSSTLNMTNSASKPSGTVTINTRPSSNANSSNETTQLENSSAHDEPSSLPANASNTSTISGDIVKDANASDAVPQSPVSDPVRLQSASPEIQIAEPEDIGENADNTQWYPVANTQPQPRLSALDTFAPADVRSMKDLVSHMNAVSQMLRLGRDHAGIWLDFSKSRLLDYLATHQNFKYNEIDEERVFWSSLANLTESLLAPQVEVRLAYNTADIEGYVVAYTKAAMKILEADARYLDESLTRNKDDIQWDPLSTIHIPRLMLCLSHHHHEAILYQLLQKQQHWDIDPLILSHSTLLLNASNGLFRVLTAFTSQLAGLLPMASTIALLFSYTLRLSARIVDLSDEFNTMNTTVNRNLLYGIDATREFILEVYRTANEAISRAVSKQLSWLTLDNSPEILFAIETVLLALAAQSKSDAEGLLAELNIDLSEIGVPNTPEIVAMGWKYATLKKYITNGRMELRVHGVDAMQADLVRVFHQHIQGHSENCRDHPVVKYLLNFIRSSKIVEYILGVDSHPQLIARSGNVIGFLAVTRTYINTDSDMIWQTVVNSQDPRTIAEVLNVLRATFGLLEIPDLLYICSKLLSLPLPNFDNKMCEFTVNLVSQIRQRCLMQTIDRPDILVPKVFIRLVRDSHGRNGLSSQDAQRLRKLGIEHLKQWAEFEYPQSDIDVICRECVDDIGKKTENAATGVEVLLSFVSRRPKYFIPKLVDEFRLTRLMIEELVSTIENPEQIVDKDSHCNNEVHNRIDFLYSIMLWRPDSIDDHLTEMIWNGLFLSEAADGEAQGQALEHVSEILRSRREPNRVLENIMHRYFPRVEDKQLSPGLLDFAKASVYYEISQSAPVLSVPNGAITVPGIERLWQFITGAASAELGDSATRWTIDLYLDEPFITHRPKTSIQATHVALVGRCISSIVSAAAKLKAYSDGTLSGEDEPMVIVASDEESYREELRFYRCLTFLRIFLQGLKLRPQYTSPLQSQQPLVLSPRKGTCIRGEEIMIRFSAHGGTSNKGDETLVIGSENTGQELAEQLVTLTGFANFNAYSLGHEIRLFDCTKTIRELNLKHVLINKVPGAEEKPLAGSRSRAIPPVDKELLQHFNELFGLLELEDRFSKEMYEFLILFPTPFATEDLLQSANETDTIVLPTSKPYKFLYVLHALRNDLEHLSLASKVDEARTLRFLDAIMVTMLQPSYQDRTEALNTLVAHQTLTCLLLALQARPSENSSKDLSLDSVLLNGYILDMVKKAASSEEQTLHGIPVKELFHCACSVLLEAAMYDDMIWTTLPESFSTLIGRLLLDDPRIEVRQAIAEATYSLSGLPPTKIGRKIPPVNPIHARYPVEKTRERLMQVWSILCTLLPSTGSHPNECHEVLDVSHAVLAQIKDGIPEERVSELSREWWDVLVTHKYAEVVGRPCRDGVIPGFAKLLLEVSGVRVLEDDHSDRKTRLRSLYYGPLFPDLSQSSTSTELEPKCPILASPTRSDLYDLAGGLIKDPEDLEEAIYMVKESIPEFHTYEEFGRLERLALRTAPGFAGLRNLANTCYLNSLFTQLFMNLEFREFIIGANIADTSQQGLLSELGKLYAYMQNTWKKWVDPTAVVESIQTFDNTAVDVNIQMDVDEFFNLLFDRLEGQILSPTDKKKFRSFYGGEIVQQIKSKECEHISERIESFSAIQCEIKDRSSLEESLQTYVEGEVMQGDNKYSCTSCGRHVDAVKRACLKDVPDHVIFHLKRFDFDINTMTRCKVNDEFQFPQSIDLTPFKVNTLNNAQPQPEPDVFELVGVLVHSGTAETGHYYSYIRERPTSKPTAESWIQYNDSDVSYFDAEKLSECCFGGPDAGSPYRFAKIHSAYMLFYQRVTSIHAFNERFVHPEETGPFRLPLPTALGNHISMENEIFARAFCAQDGTHAVFARSLLTMLPQMFGGSCSDHHGLENEAISMLLYYIHHVSSRWRGYPDLENALNLLDQRLEDCAKCADVVLRHFESHRPQLADLMLHHAHRDLRSRTVKLVRLSLDNLRTSNRPNSLRVRSDRILEFAKKQWPHLYIWTKAFNDFFQLMSALLGYGQRTVDHILEDDWFQKCLEVIYIHVGYRDDLRRSYKAYIKILNSTNVKAVHFHWFVSFFGGLLKHLQLCRPERGDNDHQKMKMSDSEWSMFQPKPTAQKMVFEWLIHLIVSAWNERAVDGIVATLLTQPELVPAVRNTIEYGLHSHAAYNFLNPVIVFVLHCPTIREVERLLVTTLVHYKEIGPDETDLAANVNLERHYCFFIANLLSENATASGYPWSRVLIKVLQHSMNWAPALLLSRDFEVRRDTQEHLETLIAQFIHVEDGHDDSHTRAGLIAVIQALCKEIRSTLTERHIEPPESSTMLSLERGQGDQLQSFLERQMEAFDRENEEETALRDTIESMILIPKYLGG